MPCIKYWFALTSRDCAGSMYDLAVAYRIYPKVSGAGQGMPYGDNKLVQAEVCLCSFVESLGKLRAKIFVLLDGCPEDYEPMVRRHIAAEDLEVLHLDGIGNHGTFGLQIDLLLRQGDSDIVYFAEDDYFYIANQFEKMVKFLSGGEGVDFISPFDHLDCYGLSLHRYPSWIRVSQDHHWRTAASTCLTFLTTKKTLRECEQVFRTYCRKNMDASLWLSMTKIIVRNPLWGIRYATKDQLLFKIVVKSWLYGARQILFGRRRILWTPIPGIATHLDPNALSPTISWKMLMQTTKQRL